MIGLLKKPLSTCQSGERIFEAHLGALGAKKEDIGTALQTLFTGVRLRLRLRLPTSSNPIFKMSFALSS